MFRYTLCIAFLGIVCSSLHAQTDNILWAGIQLRKKFNPKWSLQVQPILRLDEDFGGYQNFSIDVSLRRSLPHKLHTQLLSRTWFVPDRGVRQFVWIDIGHFIDLSEIELSMSHRLRYHRAITVNDNIDTDYIRYIVQLSPSNGWRLKPSLGYEYWLKVEDTASSINSRIIPGLRYTMNERVSFTLLLRKQFMTNNEGADFSANLWIAAIVLNL